VVGTTAAPMSPLPDGAVTALAAAPDDRTFYLVISATQTQGQSQSVTYRLFSMRVSAAGRPGPVVVLPEQLSWLQPAGIAVSPDGKQLAISLFFVGDTLHSTVSGGFETVNLVTGRVRSWTSGTAGWPGAPTWQGGSRIVALPWRHQAGVGGVALAGIRLLDTTASGTSLTSAPMITVPSSRQISDGMVTPDGRKVIDLSCTRAPAGGAQRGVFTAQLFEMPVAGGQPRVLYTKSVLYTSLDQSTLLYESCGRIAPDASWQHLLVGIFGFGRFENGLFTPLSGPDQPLPGGDAW
jgi:hypothetical protein